MRPNDPDSADTGIMFYAPERQMIVFADTRQAKLRLQYMDVSNSNPSWSPAVTIDQNIPLASSWATALWCGDCNSIIVGNIL